jgi:hypothetical protein
MHLYVFFCYEVGEVAKTHVTAFVNVPFKRKLIPVLWSIL